MGFTLDTRNDTNTVAIDVVLPDISLVDEVLLTFKSQFDGSEYQRLLNVDQTGNWLVGEIANSNIPPYSGFYDVDVHDSVADFLAINEILLPLNLITAPLNNLRGATRDQLLRSLQAQIFSGDLPTETTIAQTTPTVVEYNRADDDGSVTEYNRENDDARASTYRR